MGLILFGAIATLAVVGPWVATYSPTEFVAAPYSARSADVLLGADALGRDVLTRFLHGGRTVLLLATAATIVGVASGAFVGITIALTRGWSDAAVMRAVDVLLAFPQVVLVLLLVAGAGPRMWLLVGVVGLAHAPRTLRVIRGAALELVDHDYIQAATAMGESRWRLVTRDLLPNVAGPLTVELGLRLTYSIGLIASVSFLGFGLQPPAADWGLMINENRLGISVQPWAVVAPATAIALLTVATNLMTDGLSRAAAGIAGARAAAPRTAAREAPDPGLVHPALSERDNFAVVEVSNLTARLTTGFSTIVDDVSLRIRAGEVFALVGESGSGKTTLANAVLGYTRRGVRLVAGAVRVSGFDLLQLPTHELWKIRGSQIGFIPQDPGEALNPAMRVGRQVSEVLEFHAPQLSATRRHQRVIETFEAVALPSDDAFLRRYPHELSGGQQQRILIAMAFISGPSVVVCDEPTTGLDVITRQLVTDTIHRMAKQSNVAVLLVSHDLGTVAQISDQIAVMYAGRLIEQAPRKQLLRTPHHPYTRLLLAAVPRLDSARLPVGIPGTPPPPDSRPTGCAFAARCPDVRPACHDALPPLVETHPGQVVRCIRATDTAAAPPRGGRPRHGLPRSEQILSVENLSAWHQHAPVLRDIHLQLDLGECLAIVGASGAGKTTLGRCIAGLHSQHDGTILLRHQQLTASAQTRSVEQRRAIQYVFQNPYLSLNPRRTVEQALFQPLRVLTDYPPAAQRHRLTDALERVGLTAEMGRRYPQELSGGERQRVAIARALVCGPLVLVCDEITSALDVSVQASILELLDDIQADTDLSIIFVTHELALVKAIADKVVVLSYGKKIEEGPTSAVLAKPKTTHTRQLMSAAMSTSHALHTANGD